MSWNKGALLWVRCGRHQKGIVFVVRRKLGNAVARNRLKRRLRHICRSCEEGVPPNLVVFCQPPAIEASFSELERELKALVARLNRA